MKSLILSLVLTLSLNSWAQVPGPYDTFTFTDLHELQNPFKKQKIVVLVGLGIDHMVKQVPGILKPVIASYPKQVSSWFDEFYKKNDFEIEYMFYPSRFTLWSVFNDPDNVAVFWIGHGSESKSGDNKLFDGDGFDITEVFSSFHPNLRYLGLVGCYSKKTFEKLNSKLNFKKSNPNLKIINFDNKVRLDQSVQTALRESRKVLDSKDVKSGYGCQTRKKTGIRVKIERLCAGNDIQAIGHFPAVSVHTTHDNKIITSLPRCLKKNELQTTWAWIDLDRSDFNTGRNLISEEKMNIKITSGQRIIKKLDDYTKLDLGVFTVTHKNEDKWFGIVDPDGAPTTGVDEENLTFSINDITLSNLHSRKEHLCREMPARKF